MQRVVPDWSSEDAAPRKFNRNAAEIPRYSEIEGRFARQVQTVVSNLAAGQIDRGEAMDRFKEHLTDAETEAFVAGRRARGDTRSELNPEEEQMLDGRHARNMKYFSGFADDVQRGSGKMDYDRRAGMYAKSLWSIYTRGETSDWQDPAEQNARYYWVLDPDAEHCSTCLERAAKSRENDGFSWEELTAIGWPGERTECGPHCRCHIRVVKKSVVLPERFDDMAAAATAGQGRGDIEDILGGPHMPLKIPAAGVPYVSLRPEVVDQSLDRAGEGSDELAKLLPLIPQVTTKPVQVFEQDDFRLYVGDKISVASQRDEDGLWKVILVLLNAEPKRAA